MATKESPKTVPITTAPSPGQLVEHNGKTYMTIQEGKAYILVPPDAPLITNPNEKQSNSRQQVFYNEIQQFNRDLTIVAIKTFQADYISRANARYDPAKAQKKKSKNENKPNNQLKRKLDETLNQSQEQPAAVKKAKTESEALPVPGLPNGSNPALFSFAAQEEDLDDSFGDGFADEDFEMAELNARKAGVIRDSQTRPETKQNSVSNTNGQKASDTAERPHVVPFRILDALSATGLRALRYAKEIDHVTSITANDLSAEATTAIKVNIEHNGLSESNVIRVTTGNAIVHLSDYASRQRGKYTVIDLDPYGTAVPFLDQAVQAVEDGGLLCVTCTDSAVFNSMGYLEKTYSQYGGLPVKGDFYNEAGLRLILHAIATAAGKYGISMEPLLSLSIDYYARVFVRLRRSPAEVKLLGGKTMLVYNCDSGCGSYTVQPIIRNQKKAGKKGTAFIKHSAGQGPTAAPTCEHCGFKTHLAGPMYAGPLHNPAYIQKVLDSLKDLNPKVYGTRDRIRGMLTTALEETHIYSVPDTITEITTDKKAERVSYKADDPARFSSLPPELVDPHPFYLDPSSLARILHCLAPALTEFSGALRHLGFKSVRSHARAGSIKTNAPWSVIWDIMREWIRQKSPVKEGSLNQTSAGFHILYGDSRKSKKPVEEEWQEVLMDDTEFKVEEVDGKWRVLKKVKEAQEQPRKVEANFDAALGAKEIGSGKGLLRYQTNPRENWGPMARAKGPAKQTVEQEIQGETDKVKKP